MHGNIGLKCSEKICRELVAQAWAASFFPELFAFQMMALSAIQ
jgi:hypothetical protein